MERYRALWPHHAVTAPADERWRMLIPLTVLLGAALGVVAAAAKYGAARAVPVTAGASALPLFVPAARKSPRLRLA